VESLKNVVIQANLVTRSGDKVQDEKDKKLRKRKRRNASAKQSGHQKIKATALTEQRDYPHIHIHHHCDGTRLKENKAVEEQQKAIHKDLLRRCKRIKHIRNTYQRYQVFDDMVRERLAFHNKRSRAGTGYWTLLKTILRLPHGLPVEIIKELVERVREVRGNKDLYFNSAVRIMKLHGLEQWDGSKYAVPYNILNNSPQALEKIKSELLEPFSERNQRFRGHETEEYRPKGQDSQGVWQDKKLLN
jgi:hypothetical protein